MRRRNAFILSTVAAATLALTVLMTGHSTAAAAPQKTTAAENPQREANASSGERFEPRQMTPALASRYALYAMMSSNAYHNKDRVRFPLEIIGWVLVDVSGKPTTEPTGDFWFSGLAYDIYEKQGTDEVVFAIRGTDNIRDYLTANFAIPISAQYKKFNKIFSEYRAAHPNKKVTLTGHSLGGGVALGASVHYGITAITFDPSPRIFDGLGDHHAPAERIVIYEQGEPLQKARENWKKISEVVPKDNFYECHVIRDGLSQHRGDYLARGLLTMGASVDAELLPIVQALPAEP